MQILHEASRPYSITALNDPMSVTHFWTLSGHMMDFKLETLDYLEETTGPTLRIRVAGVELDIPASWNIVAVDRETYTIDTIPATSCATHDQDVLLFSPLDTKLVTATIQVVDYMETGTVIHPMIPKGSAMVHPLYEDRYHGKMTYYNLVTGPYDLHRYIGGRTVGEILG
jgi:hypothetical protein